MASFSTHLNVAAFVSGSVAIILNAKGVCTKNETFLFLGAGIIGGILPDIDHDNSKPIKILEIFFANLAAFLVISKYIGKVPILNIALIWLITYICVQIIFLLFKKLTTHRGIIHSIPAALFAWFFVTILWYYYFNVNAYKSYLVGMFVFIGYLTHLILDEISSVDIVGNRVKRSLGSAFKVWGEKKATYIIYSLLIIVTFLLPKKEMLIEILKRI